MPVNIDGEDREVGAARGSILKVLISPNNKHTFKRNLMLGGPVENDEQMGSRVQKQVDAMRATLTATSEVRVATHHGSHARSGSERELHA